MERAYVVGDVHGRDDLLERLHERIIIDCQLRPCDGRPLLVHLGDYIDRGGGGANVIDRVRRGLNGFEVVNLKGNHEDLMLRCLESGERDVWHNWLSNGGDETLRSLGLSLLRTGYDPVTLREALGEDRVRWLYSLTLYHRWENYLFVHAGIRPRVSMDEQTEHDLLWIRNAFLESNVDHGFVVVHGHTPSSGPVNLANRIGVDTGASSCGELTAVVLEPSEEPRFLTITGEPGKGS